MNTPQNPFDDPVEAPLARLQPSVAADGLRDATLGRVQRELRASHWDRRLGRIAASLLVVGIGMNVATINKRPALPTGGQLAARPTTEAIAELAVTMAEVTDIETANIFARHLAALGGFPLGSDQADAIAREIDRRLSPAVARGKEG
ncbi:MAG: hypothetical protein GXP28_05975 [Planctomycetes bacterium]|nr:hypothetical protein [Planctomycetota bacterium]